MSTKAIRRCQISYAVPSVVLALWLLFNPLISEESNFKLNTEFPENIYSFLLILFTIPVWIICFNVLVKLTSKTGEELEINDDTLEQNKTD